MKRTWIVLFCALILDVKCQSKLRRWQDAASFDTGGNNMGGHPQLGYVGASSNLNSYNDGSDVNGYGGNMNEYDTGNNGAGFDTGGRGGSGLNDYGSGGSVNDYGGGGGGGSTNDYGGGGSTNDYDDGADITGYGGNNNMGEYSGGDSKYPGNDVNTYGGFHSNDMAGFDGHFGGNGVHGSTSPFNHNPWEHRQVKTVVKHTVKNIAIPHPVPAPVHIPIPKYIRYFKPFPVAKPVAIPEVIPVVKHIQKPIAYFTSIPVARSVPVPKFIGLPVQVRVPRPIVIRVPKLVPVAKKFAVPITVHIPKPYVVPVYQQVPVPIPHKIPKIINIVKEVPHIVKKPVPIYVDEHGRTEFAPSNAISNYISNGGGFGGRPHDDFNPYSNFDSEEEYNDGYEQEYDIHPPRSPGYTNSFGETYNQYQKYPQQSPVHTKPRAHRLPKNPQQHSSTTGTKLSSIDSPRHILDSSSKDANKSPGSPSAYELSLEDGKKVQTSISSSSSSTSESSSGNQQMSPYQPSSQVATSGTSTSTASQPYSQNALSTFSKNLQNMASMYAKSYASNMMNNRPNQYSFEYHHPSTGSTTSQFFSAGPNHDANQFGKFAQHFPQLFGDNLKNTFENTYNSGNVFSSFRNSNNNNHGVSYGKHPSTLSNQLSKQTTFDGDKNNYASQNSGNMGTPKFSYNQNSGQEQASSNFGYDDGYNSQSYASLLNAKPHETELSHTQGYSQLHQTSNLESNNPFSTQFQSFGDGQFREFKINHKDSRSNTNQDHKLSSSYNNPSGSAYVPQNLNYYDAIYNSNNNEGYKNVKPQESGPEHNTFSNGYYYNHYKNSQEADNKPFFTNSGIPYASGQNKNIINNQNDAYKSNEDILRTYSGSHSTSLINSIANNDSSLKNTFLSNNHGNHQQLDNHKPASASNHKQTVAQQGYLENHKNHGQSASTNSNSQDNQARSSSQSHALTSVEKSTSSFPQIPAVDSTAAAYQSVPYSEPADDTYQHASRFDKILSSNPVKIQGQQPLNTPRTSSNDISKFYSAPDPLADYIASVSNSDESSSQDQVLSSSELMTHHKLKQDASDSRIQTTPWNATHTSMSIVTQVQSPHKLSPSYWSPPLIVSPNPMSDSSTAFSSQELKVINGPDSAEKKKLALSSGQASPVYKPSTDPPQYKTSISVAYQVADNLPLKTSR